MFPSPQGTLTIPIRSALYDGWMQRQAEHLQLLFASG